MDLGAALAADFGSLEKNMIYRADIQILRGLSVIFVVIFHLGAPWMRSGFVGVDVFFVISGFLMTKLFEEGHVYEFYIRRARRLLPAYFFIIFIVLIFSAFIVIPPDFDQVVDQIRFASVFASNLGYWSQNSYFSKSEFNPLLHLWSLGVEIQFYILFPVIIYIEKRSRLSISAIAAVSLLACLFVLTVSPKTSFFMMPLRLWEFMIGILSASRLEAASLLLPHKRRSLISYGALLVVLFIPFLPIDGQSLGVVWGHPGLLAVIVCCATGLILGLGGLAGLQNSAVGRGLEPVWKFGG